MCLAPAAELRIEVSGERGQPVWTRLEVRGADGRMYQAPGAIRDIVTKTRGGGPWYLGSFIVEGRAEMDVPAGEYTVIAEHGLEYERVERQARAPGEIKLRLRPWVRMRERGWWSGDLHAHRPPRDAPGIAQAEDLNVLALVNRNKRELFREWPARNVEQAGPHNWLTLRNAEDERRGGSWIFDGLSAPLELAAESGWSPPGLVYIRQARAQRRSGELLPWFDLDMPFWWEVPVVMALEPPDSLDILHNQFMQYGIDQSEYWGKPRDRAKYPGAAGFVDYCFELYYRYLNLGFKVAPSAGTGSGVMPNPAGYDRVYARVVGEFSVEKWYRAIREGRSFVTNGPILLVSHTPGKVEADVEAREPIDRVELIANGMIVEKRLAAGERRMHATFAIDERKYSWCAVRAFVKVEGNIRLAHSSPIWLAGKWDARADAEYFRAWIDELIGGTIGQRRDPALLPIYREARERYERLARVPR